MGNVVAYTQVNFAIPDNKNGAIYTGTEMAFILDDEANGGKTTFEEGETCHLVILSNPEWMKVYLNSTAGGTAVSPTPDAMIEFTDRVVVTSNDDLKKALSFQPSTGISIKNISNNYGNVPGYSIQLQEITFVHGTFGIFDVTYYARGRTANLYSPIFYSPPNANERVQGYSGTYVDSIDVLVVATPSPLYDANAVSLTVTFIAKDEELEPVPTTLEIIDFITGDKVSGATVAVSGTNFSFNGITNASGQLYIGSVQPGSYTAIVTKTGMTQGANDRNFTV